MAGPVQLHPAICSIPKDLRAPLTAITQSLNRVTFKSTSVLVAEPDYERAFSELDERLYNDFFRGIFPALSFFAFRYTRTMETAEEIANDALLKLWQRRLGFSHPLAMRSFVYTAARFACLNHVRDHKRQLRTLREHAWCCPQRERFVLQQLVNHEVCREALEAVSALPTQCRRIFEMLFLEQQTPAQVAAHLGLSVSTVRNQKARALLLLRRQMEDTGNFPLDTEFLFTEL